MPASASTSTATATATSASTSTSTSNSTLTLPANRRSTAALIEHDRFDAAFVFWHARHAEDPPATLAALVALARQATRDRRHQLAAGYDAMHCALRRGSRWYPASLGARLLPHQTAPISGTRLRHDAAQFEYLHALGVLGDEFQPIIAHLRRLATWLDGGQPHGRGLLYAAKQDDPNDSADLHDVDEVYDRIIHLRPTPCVAQPLSGHAVQAARAAFSLPHDRHGIVVIDDFLSAAALGELLRFCLQSTVWLRELGHGRLGASYENGFNCPLLVQCAHAVFGHGHGQGHEGLHWSACKHPPRLPGEALHADQGAIKLQLWLTPDAANLDPATGGMFIRDRHGNTRYIAYRQNRAVIFPARLLHGAATRSFRDDHGGRRIDLTGLSGAPRYSTPSARIAAISSSP